jgi:protein transport protein SEC61 subunit gamma and related proteins
MESQVVARPNKLKRFFKETIRVLRITKRPSGDEYKSLVKVTGLGVAIIGALGFVIFLIKQLLF